MYCSHCGKQIPDNAIFCGFCGAKIQGGYTPPHPSEPRPDTVALPMKWYKFLIYVQLFLGTVVALFTAVSYLRGAHWDELFELPKALMYGFFPSLRVVDIVTGILYLCMAAFCILVRQQLAHYKRNALKLLYGLRGLSIVTYLFWGVLTTVVLSDTYDIGELIVALLLSPILSSIMILVLVSLEKVYFTKRQHLFVND